MGPGGDHHEGRLRQDPGHLHHRGHRHRVRGPAPDELLQIRQDRGRVPGMAQAHRHLLGGSQRSGLHPCLCHPVLLGRAVERMTGRRGMTHGDT